MKPEWGKELHVDRLNLIERNGLAWYRLGIQKL